jgi:hypothetical protein
MAVTVKKRKDKYWVFINHKGKRKSKCIGDKRTAERVAKQIEARLALGDLGILDEGIRRPFDDYFRTWLDSYVKAHCKDATYKVYETGYRLYLEPAFGKRDIGEITREDVKRLAYGMLAQGKSRSYVKGTLAPLVEMFNHAIEDGHATVNPALRILSAAARMRASGGKRSRSCSETSWPSCSTPARSTSPATSRSSCVWPAPGCASVKPWHSSGATSTSTVGSRRFAAVSTTGSSQRRRAGRAAG